MSKKLKPANSVKVSHVTIVNGGKVTYEVRKIVSKKSMLTAGPAWVEWVVFRNEGGWCRAVGHSTIKANAYAHARMCREYGCVY